MPNRVLTDTGSWTEEFSKMAEDVLEYESLKRIFLSLETIENVACACAELCGVVHQVTNEVIIGMALKKASNEKKYH